MSEIIIAGNNTKIEHAEAVKAQIEALAGALKIEPEKITVEYLEERAEAKQRKDTARQEFLNISNAHDKLFQALINKTSSGTINVEQTKAAIDKKLGELRQHDNTNDTFRIAQIEALEDASTQLAKWQENNILRNETQAQLPLIEDILNKLTDVSNGANISILNNLGDTALKTRLDNVMKRWQSEVESQEKTLAEYRPYTTQAEQKQTQIAQLKTQYEQSLSQTLPERDREQLLKEYQALKRLEAGQGTQDDHLYLMGIVQQNAETTQRRNDALRGQVDMLQGQIDNVHGRIKSSDDLAEARAARQDTQIRHLQEDLNASDDQAKNTQAAFTQQVDAITAQMHDAKVAAADAKVQAGRANDVNKSLQEKLTKAQKKAQNAFNWAVGSVIAAILGIIPAFMTGFGKQNNANQVSTPVQSLTSAIVAGPQTGQTATAS
jgi:hypothetical protein